MDRNASPNESTQLRRYALECLLERCLAERPRLHKAAEAYVIRATAMYDAEIMSMEGVNTVGPRVERIQSLIRDLVDADDERTTEIIAANDWEWTTRVVLLYLVRKYKNSQVLGKQLIDYFQDAVCQLLDRSRHFPQYRGVELNAFLCETARSNIDHELKKAAKQPPVLKIVGGVKANAAAGEYSEHQLPPVHR